MGKHFLLDTNVVIDYMGNRLPDRSKTLLADIFDDEINISVINKIELLGFSKIEQVLIDFVNCANIYHMNDGVVDKTIEVRKLYRVKLPDAIIAATAIMGDFTLISNNDKDFKGIKELKFMNPYNL